MKKYNLCFLGFGNVGRALARLFVSKSAELKENYGIEWQITGVVSRRIGWLANVDGFDAATLLAGDDEVRNSTNSNGISDWLATTQPDVVFETTSLDPNTGQPAI